MANVSILIDFANINIAFDIIKKQKKLSFGSKIDYTKLITALALGNTVVSKSIYLATNPMQKDQIKFFDYFRNDGFRVVTKPLKEISVDDGRIMRKANFDVEITMDACTHMWRRECDEIILISGDSDFAYLIEMAQKLNFTISVLSSQATISSELRKLADRVILLDQMDPDYFVFENHRKRQSVAA